VPLPRLVYPLHVFILGAVPAWLPPTCLMGSGPGRQRVLLNTVCRRTLWAIGRFVCLFGGLVQWSCSVYRSVVCSVVAAVAAAAAAVVAGLSGLPVSALVVTWFGRCPQSTVVIAGFRYTGGLV
jgi:hypothetical protein